jgi:hypothetical protein
MDAFAEAARPAATPPATPSDPPARELVLRHSEDLSELGNVVDPITGEVVGDPADIATDELAALAYRMRQADKKHRTWLRAIEQELTQRLQRDGQHDAGGRMVHAQVGSFQLKLATKGRRDWDAEGLHATVSHLREEGQLSADDVAGLFPPQPLVVNGNVAKRLLDRTSGDTHNAIARCYRWQSEKPKLTVAPAALEQGGQA